MSKKNYQCFRRNLSLCRHFPTISFLLLREAALLAREIRVFSVRQSWHFLVSLLYGAASLWMLHFMVKGMPFFFSSQIWVERAVLWALASLMKELLWA